MPGSQGEAASFFERIAAEPALVQLVAVVFVGAIAARFLARTGRRVREARARSGVASFLLGVEAAWLEDVDNAHRRLDRVARDEPSNLVARLLRAELMTALGRPAEAHSEHLALDRAFGSRAPRNQVGLARALLAAGHPREAVDAAARATTALPEDLDAWRVRFASERAARCDAAAAASGARLAARLPSGDERDDVRRQAASCAERAAHEALRELRFDTAADLAALARGSLGDNAPLTRRLAARIRLASAAHRALPERAGDLLPVPFAVSDELAMATPDARDRLLPLESAGRALDAIEANVEHLERLCRRWADGDPDARVELLELGPDVADALLAHAVARGPEDQRFPSLFQTLGPDGVAIAVDAWLRRPDALRSLRDRGRATATLSVILRGFGAAARDAVDELLTTDERELRKALVDYYLALADPEAFGRVLEALPPIEVVQRINEVAEDLLVPFLRALPEGHYVLDVLLPEGGCVRDIALLEAIPGARAPAALERLVVRRGFGRSLVAALIERLGRADLGPIAGRVLDSFGERAVMPLVMAFADPDRPAELRRAVAERLVAARGAAVLPLCRCFGSAPTALDADVLAVLVQIGDAAVPALREAYLSGGLLERIVGPFARRRTHRREMVVRTLARIASFGARTTLVALREREGDPDLALRLAQAVHRIDAEGTRLLPPSADDRDGEVNHGT